jgi:acyl carrier protein
MTCPTTFAETAALAPIAGIGAAGSHVEPSQATPSDDVQDFVRSVVARYAGHYDGVIAMRRPLLDFGVDVLALIDIVMDLEARFGIELDPDEILSWLTAADMVESVSAALSR